MKAKTRTRLITVLNALLGVVFAFTLGFTYSSSTATKTVGTNVYSTASYLANNNWQLINSTLENPIPYGNGARNAEIAISYTLYYDFDVKLTYSLTWSDGTTTTDASDDVILHYSDRDRFIVDEEYIYLKDKVTKGEGKFIIITGVEFLNPDDADLVGKSLTINVEAEVQEISTTSNYIDSHAMYENSIAGNAWLKIKSEEIKNITTADIIVYNYRYKQANGIAHPGANTAYSQTTYPYTYTDEQGTTVTATGYKDATELYGNRYNAGAGMYVMTGSSAITITVESGGYWEAITTTTALSFTNNIYYNFAKNWGDVTYKNANHTISSITVPANSAVYINIYDSIEITSIMETSGESISFDDYLLLSSFNINGKSILANKITNLEGVTSASATNSATYSATTYSITNTSTCNPSWYDVYSGSGAKEFATNLAITNETANTVTYEVKYQPQYTISNGVKQLQSDGGSASDFSGTEWVRKVVNYGTVQTATVVVAPYSTVTIANTFKAETGLSGSIFETYGNYYDVWMSIDVTSVSVTSTSETELTTGSVNSVSVEVNGLDYYVRNNSNVTVTIAKNTTITIWKFSYSYASVSNEPVDWDVSYWKYYYISGGNYVQATATSTWVSTTYFSRTENTTTEDITTTEEITLVPGESAKVGAITYTGTSIVQGSITGTITTGTASIVNNGLSSAFILNDSADTSYYVRFTGTYSDSSDDIVTDSGYNYYIGIVRPGQIVEIPMSQAGAVDLIEVDEEYSASDISGWTPSSTVTSAFETYFK